MHKYALYTIFVGLGLFVFIIALFFYGSFSDSSDLFGDVISKVDTTENVVFLTFDDGPSYRTPEILDILKEKNVTATFFVIGENIDEKTIPIMKRELTEGHSIGTHSMTHSYLVNNIYEEVFKSKKKIEEVIGENIVYFRPPFGFRTPEVLKQAENYGLKTIMWSSFPKDYKNPVNKTVKIVMRDLKPGLIVDLHDTGKDDLITVEALPVLIDSIRAQGYEFGNLNDYLK